MAATTKPPPRRRRAEVAELLAQLLTAEPQSAASLARALGYEERDHGRSNSSRVIANALAVLAARGQARQIPAAAGSRGGWARADSPHDSALIAPVEIEFDYVFEKRLALADCFVDDSYQRPLTALVNRIERDFDPYLFQALMLSDRGSANQPARFAIIDGQTRWVAAQRIGVPAGPAQIFTDLTPEQEADIFWRIQKHRHGVVSFHRFRAQLRAGDQRSLAILALVNAAGYELGDGPTHLKAVAAIEHAYDSDAFLLERTLNDLRDAWPQRIPEGTHIRGCHYFFRHYPLDRRGETADVDDERLVKRLKVTGPDGLHRRALAAREVGGRGSADKWMAQAIQSAYLSGGGRAA